MRLITRFLAVVLALFVAARYVPGIVIDGFYTAVIVALVLGLLNLVVRPILVVLTLPVTLLTFGLFLFVINATIFWFAGTFIEGFSVSGFIPALFGSLIVSGISWFVHKLT